MEAVMTLQEAVALQPAWVNWWLNWMLVGVFVLPAVLIVFPASRIVGIIALFSSLLSGFGVSALYDELGYVKLLGLPHIALWVPVVFLLLGGTTRGNWPVWPRRIAMVVLATILVSLAFDITDVARYLLGERTPLAGTLAGA